MQGDKYSAFINAGYFLIKYVTINFSRNITYKVWLWHKGSHATCCSKDMTVHFSTYTSNDFNALMPVVWKLWHWYDMFLCLVAKMSDQFLEQKIDIKFCGKLEKNVTFVQCSPRLMGEKQWKSLVFLNGMKWFKECH